MYDPKIHQVFVLYPYIGTEINKYYYDICFRDMIAVRIDGEESINKLFTLGCLRFVDGQLFLRNGITFVFGGHSHLMAKARCEHLRAGGRTPPIALSEEEIELGEQAFGRLGFGLDRKVVLVHCREAGYIGGGSHNDLRNASPKNYVPALRLLIERGYVVVRLGDRTMTPLQELGPGFVDLALCEHRHSILEPYLASQCQFMIHCHSGPEELAMMFDKPALAINFLFLHGIIPEFREVQLPKTCIDSTTGRPLTFVETAERGLLFADKRRVPTDFGVDFCEHGADAIEEAVAEMLVFLDAGFPRDTKSHNRDYGLFLDIIKEIDEIRSNVLGNSLDNYFTLYQPHLLMSRQILTRFAEFTRGPLTNKAISQIRRP
jgi:putative glycosyltransferase (TIGR04372 family)